MKKFLKSKAQKVKKVAIASLCMLCAAVPAFATETGDTLAVNFDVTKLFSFAQVMIDAMLPVVYVTLGISLGFLIIRSLKSAFSSY